MRCSGFSRLHPRSAVIGALLFLAGCATDAPPLLTPIATARTYGYAETALDGGRFEITYVAPLRRTARLGSVAPEDTEAAGSMALDLATWRAAQIALAQGYEGFRLEGRHVQFATVVDPHLNQPFPLDRSLRFRERWGTDYPAPPFAGTPDIHLQAQAVVGVTLLHAPGPGDYDAAATSRRFEQIYSDPHLADRG